MLSKEIFVNAIFRKMTYALYLLCCYIPCALIKRYFSSGLGMCLSYVGSYTAICWLFYPNPSLPLTSLSIGGAVGHCLVPLIIERCLSEYGLNGCLLLCAGLTLQCAPCGLMIHTVRQYFVTRNECQELFETLSPTTNSVFKTLFSDVLVLLVWANSFLMALSSKCFYISQKGRLI